MGIALALPRAFLRWNNRVQSKQIKHLHAVGQPWDVIARFSAIFAQQFGFILGTRHSIYLYNQKHTSEDSVGRDAFMVGEKSI